VKAIIDPRYVLRARDMVEEVDRRSLDRTLALELAIAKGIELAARVRQLEKSTGLDLPDGTKIRARRDQDGRLIISQIVNGREQTLLQVG
jgi:hypothetical protein